MRAILIASASRAWLSSVPLSRMSPLIDD